MIAYVQQMPKVGDHIAWARGKNVGKVIHVTRAVKRAYFLVQPIPAAKPVRFMPEGDRFRTGGDNAVFAVHATPEQVEIARAQMSAEELEAEALAIRQQLYAAEVARCRVLLSSTQWGMLAPSSVESIARLLSEWREIA